jgi:pyridoxal phosphate enzyme (YggS family)
LPRPPGATNLAGFVTTASGFRDRIEEVRERIARAADRSGRSPGEVRLVAVAKTFPAGWVLEGVEAGLTDIGENRVQEAEPKIAAVGRGRVRWHLVGHLQRNKAARAAELFDRIHSVDGVDLARTLSRHASAAGRILPVLVQVNVSGEASKSGVAPEGLESLVGGIADLPGLALDGLMCIGPIEARGDEARPWFARLRALRDRTEAALGRKLPELSMGMSGDFEAAVAEGSTMVRIGTALFGPRT